VSSDCTVPRWRAIVLVFAPFVFAYYLSYLYRTINAVIAGELTTDLGIGTTELGLLTSAYFLSFAILQLPVGVLLDRFGPRRVQSALMLIAALGALLFSVGHSFTTLLIGRAMIGVGVAAAFMAGLKAVVLWFPKERVAFVNGWFVMIGAAGALSATTPAAWVLDWLGWRGLFALLAAATSVSALLIDVAVPDMPTRPANRALGLSGLKLIYTDGQFWRIAPLSATCIGTAWALQGLWAAPWLADVENLDQSHIVSHLSIMGAALCAGALLFGIGADRLRSRGVRPQTLLGLAACGFIAAQIALIAGARIPPDIMWAVIAAVGGATVLSYATLAEYYPKEMAGQANAALNILHIGGACIIQYGIGLVVDHWASVGGHHPAIAYKTAFALNLVLQIIAFAYFAIGKTGLIRQWLSAGAAQAEPSTEAA
jgi:MFS family permease